MRYQHYLITRFSVFEPHWKPIINDEWYQKRIELFNKYCVPSVLNQTAKEFTWLILVDQETGGKFYDQIKGGKVLLLDRRVYWREQLKHYLAGEVTAPYLITSRLDSDDIIHENYIRHIQKAFRPSEEFLNINNGYFYDGVNYYKSNYQRGPFLSYIEPRKSLKTVYHKEHGSVYARRQIETPLWIQTVHDCNHMNKVTDEMELIKPNLEGFFNMHNFCVVAFYTEGTPYVGEAKHLERNCQELGLHCHLKGYQNTGSWVRNCAIKPRFILDMMEKHPGQDILYLDADARIRQYPKLFDNFKEDIGVHYRKKGKNIRELLSGTIFLKNTKRVRNVVKKWAEAQLERPDVWDQKVLDMVLLRETGISIHDLPPTYTQIFDSMRQAGNPVIEHMQASRRYKQLVLLKEETMIDVPEVIGKVRIRQHKQDGSYYIVRRDPDAEAFLDKHFKRSQTKLRWYSAPKEQSKILDIGRYISETCYIVGKGPSLDYLNATYFDQDHTVIALNESIHQVEKLNLPNKTFCLQQDAKLRDTCRPKKADLLVSIKAYNHYKDLENIHIFDSRDYNLSLNALSAVTAITIAQSLGAKRFIMLCFDACVNRNTGYAECIGYPSTQGGHPNRFLSHRATIENRAKCTWVLPTKKKVLLAASSDKLKLSSDSQTEHRAPVPPQHPVDSQAKTT